MDGTTLAAIAAGAGILILGGAGVMAWWSLPREEDWLAAYFADLEKLATASGHSHAAPLAGGQRFTAEDHLPDSGAFMDVESSASPPLSSTRPVMEMAGRQLDGAAAPASCDGGSVLPSWRVH